MPGSGRKWWSYLTKSRYPRAATNDAWLLTHRSIAKQASDDSFYLLANEWISSQIATFLRLPVPPAALARGGVGHKGMFASLEFTGSDSEPDDVEPEACIRNHSNTCVGILLFDVVIANCDRHAGNIRVDVPSDPRQIAIIDHDRALFGTWETEGISRLTKLRDRLALSGGSVTGQNRHCFLDFFASWEHFEEWYSRIESIPDWFVQDVCNESLGLPLSRAEADAAADFLVYRKKNIRKLVWENRHEFRGIDQQELFNKLDRQDEASG